MKGNEEQKNKTEPKPRAEVTEPEDNQACAVCAVRPWRGGGRRNT